MTTYHDTSNEETRKADTCHISNLNEEDKSKDYSYVHRDITGQFE